jgi:hypothetical protein
VIHLLLASLVIIQLFSGQKEFPFILPRHPQVLPGISRTSRKDLFLSCRAPCRPDLDEEEIDCTCNIQFILPNPYVNWHPLESSGSPLSTHHIWNVSNSIESKSEESIVVQNPSQMAIMTGSLSWLSPLATLVTLAYFLTPLYVRRPLEYRGVCWWRDQ